VPPAIIGLHAAAASTTTAAASPQGGATARLTTEGLLIDVPLPDFSMPFNVITLCSTLVAFFFGSMLNVVVRKGRRREEEEEEEGEGGKGSRKGKGAGGRIREKLRALWERLRGKNK
jgi:hypothetical protein